MRLTYYGVWDEWLQGHIHKAGGVFSGTLRRQRRHFGWM
jgi:hypothetical protein